MRPSRGRGVEFAVAVGPGCCWEFAKDWVVPCCCCEEEEDVSWLLGMVCAAEEGGTPFVWAAVAILWWFV